MSSREFKKIGVNFLNLSLIQVASYILPFVTVPYLFRILGVEQFGLIMFALAFVSYFTLIVDYGFNLLGTSNIARCGNSKVRMELVYSQIFWTKLAILLFLMLVYFFLIFEIELLEKEKGIYFILFGMVVSHALFPGWFFQGMQKMHYISYAIISSRLMYTLLIFVFINYKTDVYLVAIFNAFSLLVASFYGLYIVHCKLKFKLYFFKFKWLRNQLADGWKLFLTTVVSGSVSSLNVLILGFLFGTTIAGVFSAIDKIILASKSMINAYNQAVFPFFSMKKKTSNGNLYFYGAFVALVFGLVLFSLLLFFYSDKVVLLLYSNESSPLMKEGLMIMSISPLLYGTYTYIGMQLLICNGMKDKYANVLMFGVVLNGLLCIFLSKEIELLGAVWSLIVTEIVVCLLLLKYLVNFNFLKKAF